MLHARELLEALQPVGRTHGGKGLSPIDGGRRREGRTDHNPHSPFPWDTWGVKGRWKTQD